MTSRGMRDQRAWIFLAVLLAHAVLVCFALLSSWRVPASRQPEPWVLLTLRAPPAGASASTSAPTTPAASAPRKVSHRRQARVQPETPSNAITRPPDTLPPIDWPLEAELAAKNAAEQNGQRHYRDLASLSPEQLDWARRNHMEPAPPGIEWGHPRVQIDKDSGLPIIWLNDRCALVMIIVFCRIGHIEPNGQLFKHLRE